MRLPRVKKRPGQPGSVTSLTGQQSGAAPRRCRGGFNFFSPLLFLSLKSTVSALRVRIRSRVPPFRSAVLPLGLAGVSRSARCAARNQPDGVMEGANRQQLGGGGGGYSVTAEEGRGERSHSDGERRRFHSPHLHAVNAAMRRAVVHAPRCSCQPTPHFLHQHLFK